MRVSGVGFRVEGFRVEGLEFKGSRRTEKRNKVYCDDSSGATAKRTCPRSALQTILQVSAQNGPRVISAFICEEAHFVIRKDCVGRGFGTLWPKLNLQPQAP